MSEQQILSLSNPVASIDIAVKLNSVPKAQELSKTKQYQLKLEYNGLRLSIKLKGKSWRKALSTVEEIEGRGGQWVMSISGKVGNSGDVTELDSAGIQVFEKKSKPEPDTQAVA